MYQTFNKPVKTFEEQIEVLKSRGLIINDTKSAIHILSHINYYRLSAYMLPFKPYKNNCENPERELFKQGTKIDDIVNLYNFDRELRVLLFAQIERIEISIRTKLAHYLSIEYGSHWQDNPNIFKNKIVHRGDIKTEYNIFNEIQNHIKKEMDNNYSETFIKHYREKYENPVNPPSWMCVEIMYFSQLSKIYQNLRNRKDKVRISSCYDLPPDILESWLHTVNYVRNICAHHSRLWNRVLQIIPKKFISPKQQKWLENTNDLNSDKLYYFLCILVYILEKVVPENNFKQDIFLLIEKYPNINISQMGFPPKWKEQLLWQ